MGRPTSSRRPRQTVWICLGSNIEPEPNLRLAVSHLARETRLEAVSRVFESPPVGAPGTPRYLNAALRLRTDRGARSLKLEVLRPLEARLGRVRRADRNAPRTIDLDIALYDRIQDLLADYRAGQ